MQTRNFLVSLTLLLFTASAFAGLSQPFGVEVDHVNMTASGDMLSARNSKNDVEYVGCGVRAYDDGAGGAFYSGFCQAMDADEEWVVCTTTNPGLLNALAALTDSAFITFNWNEDYECTKIGNSANSFYLEKGKAPKKEKSE